MRGLFGAAGPGREVGPRRLPGVVVRPLSFTVRPQHLPVSRRRRAKGRSCLGR
jgi:hypothetical protein